MKRRGFLGIAFVLALPKAIAQAPKRIGVVQFRGGLMNQDMPGGIAFLAAMKALGYREGRDFVLEERLWEPHRQQDAPTAVRELVRLKADVIIAAAPPSIVAAKAVTTQVPVVMMYSAEPVAMGLVSSLNKPGGNLTGLAWDHGFETNLKALELLKQALPALRRVALLWDASDSAHPIYAQHFAKAAPQIGLTLISVDLRQAADIQPAFLRMRNAKAEALIVLPSGQITIPNRKAIMGLAAKDRLPTLVSTVDEREYPGALLRYGPNLARMPGRAAAYVDRILKGAKPADLPIEQPDKYDLVIDRGVAGQLGIKLSRALLVQADKVIE